jgi:D-beta-D-heptose 7-phosphate kinase / D-beta-D-heptose 1-phosphate adenosyltransferase
MNFDKFKRGSEVKILVIGDLMLDYYLVGKCNRISPEAPVQVVDIKEERNVLGGAGNVVRNLIDFNVQVGVLSVLGQDETSKIITTHLEDLKVKQYITFDAARHSSIKNRILVDNQQILRFDRETKEGISSDSEKKLITEFDKLLKEYDLIILSDYAKGVLTDNLIKYVINESKKFDKKVIIDPKGPNFTKYSGAFLLTPNKAEAELATNRILNDDDSIESCLKLMKDKYDLEISMITLSENGIAYYDQSFHKRKTYAKEVYDVTGAGDTVLASLGLGFALELDLDTIVGFANAAAGLVVGKTGSSTTNIDEVKQYYKSYFNKNSFGSKLLDKNELVDFIKAERKIKNNKFVFTNGCFDILHVGHISYLEKAKNLGHYLIVGLNSDASVKRLKGEERPINNVNARATMLNALSFVDFIVIFDEETPLELIKEIRPDILVKGADYNINQIIGKEYSKKVKTIDFIDNYSTTSIINKLKK